MIKSSFKILQKSMAEITNFHDANQKDVTYNYFLFQLLKNLNLLPAFDLTTGQLGKFFQFIEIESYISAEESSF